MQLIYLYNVFTVSVNGTRAYCAVCQTHSHAHTHAHIHLRICKLCSGFRACCKYYHYFSTLLSFFFQFTSRRCRFVSVGSSWKLSATWQNLLPKILIRKLRNTEYSACTFSCWPNYKIVCWFSAKCHIMSDANALTLSLSLSLVLTARVVANTMNIFAQVLSELAENTQWATISNINIRIIC